MRSLVWPEWAKKANIYEVNVRQYTPEGTIKSFAEHLPRLSKMGVDILWFMPIFPISEEKRKGTMGSYYAPATYVDVNPQMGTMADFKSMLQQAHKLGMYVIIDWVPNHTGWDHPWIVDHPDYYLRDKNGDITEPLDGMGNPSGWTDVAKLDFNHAPMRRQMIADMLYWIEVIGIDGFRMDMALLVPLDFWQEASSALLSAKSDIFLVAESEHYDHLNHGCFHAFYGWSWHHMLNQIAQHEEPAAAIDHWYHHTRPSIYQGVYMFFTSNHDENSWSGSEIERMGLAYHAMAVLNFTADAVPLLYSGQEEPYLGRIDFFEKDDIGFKHYAEADFYHKLMRLRHVNPALWHPPYGGSMHRIMGGQEGLYAFKRSKESDAVVVILNLSPARRLAVIDREVIGSDIFDNNNKISWKTGDHISMAPWSYKVISNINL
jgi:alpha-amylase